MQASTLAIVFAFIGGLGLFLFGLRLLTEGLQQVAGDRMRSILEKGTKNPLRGVLTGMATTVLVQSSTATTILSIGLVNAGLLTLRQAIGIIMGANIGTTLTVFIIGFNVQAYSLPIVGVGALIYILTKNKKVQMVAQAILGFGLMFYGLSVIGGGLSPLKDLPIFTELMLGVDNNAWLGVLIGVVFTVLVQSSAATIGVMQQLAEQGAMTYQQCVPILFGDNIGTAVTSAFFGALGAGVAAKRAALSHTLFNVIGTLIFLPLFMIGIFEPMVTWITNTAFAIVPGFDSWATMNVKLQIAQTHAVFNIANTLIHLPFVAGLAWLVTKLVPDKATTEEDEATPRFIDKRFLNNPPMAITQALRETLRMGRLAQEAFDNAIRYFEYPEDKACLERGIELENAIDRLEREITDYIVLVSQRNLSFEESARTYMLLQAVNDIERIGDHCENIFEQAEYSQKYGVVFSDEARDELNHMIRVTADTIALALEAMHYDRRDLARQVVINENAIDKMEQDYRREHIRRLNEFKCNGSNGAVFLDMLSNLERIGDHCRNIAGYVLGEE
ncbi:MAG: Na/Pi cotransporter family protein [Syntrophomonadaceae bacterium]|nr:Na/Pi cotransporter family protein [Syntrophomonadaceae bacterium]